AALERILYVEDDPGIRLVGKMALETVGGFRVHDCASGAEALAVAGFAPQLLLLDVMMPGMDGIATLERLWQQPETAGVPAVFMTAKVQPEEIAQLRAAGAIEVIPKPFEPMTLAAQLRAIWACLPDA
ncbi:response regulator, partial [Niveibacterium sp.]|uniref:response regulator n=1 Tax=Niveibacterium sp. TaxID=2017444 RepID=UPI0035B41BE8